jgi:hypothetical protein
MEPRTALSRLLDELLGGPTAGAAFVLNPEDPGLLPSLAKLSAAEASAIPSDGGASIAAHVDHLRYGLELLNRWSRGENPFVDADYSASWKRSTVSEAGWADRQESLRREAASWRDALLQPRPLDDVEFMGVVASVVHLAYHLGAIRQINRAVRGPEARD